MSKLYIETPVSVRPEKAGPHFCFDPNGFIKNNPIALRYDKVTNRWFNGSDEYHPEFWLRPVSAQEIFDKEKALMMYVNQKHTQKECIGFIDGIDNLLPTIVLLKEENEKLQARIRELDVANWNLSAEIEKLKNPF